MARKKKNGSVNGDSGEEKSRPNIHGDAKRSIVAVFLFALAIIFILSFFGSAGALGKYLNKIIAAVFGWGKWLSPAILTIAGIVLLFRKEALFYVTKLAGLVIAFFSFLALLHLYIDPEKMSKFAKEGLGGGYAGFGISYLFLKLTGIYGSSIILIALLMVGFIMAFNFSIGAFFHRIYSAYNKNDEEGVIGGEAEVGGAEKEVELAEEPEEEKDNVWVEEPVKPSPEFSVKPVMAGMNRKLKLEAPHSRKWMFPPVDLLETSTGKAHGGDVARNARIIRDTLKHFNIDVELGEILVGPTVTQYSFRPGVGVKLSKITTLHNDLALALAAHPIRIEAPIPGKSLIGIEVPNKTVAYVHLRNLLESDAHRNRKSNLMLALGEDVSGSYIFADLKKMPHLMIAGATGTGKSVCINSILLSLIYQNSPDDLKLVLIDPKRVELSLYNGIPHLLSDTIVENGKALNSFKWAINKMEERYRLFQDTGSRDLESYNQKAKEGFNRKITNEETGEVIEEKIDRLPYIVIVIDELADLMSSHGKEVEGAIIRLAQMARAVGIHLIVSTQRPSVEVLTGLIKANITTRVAFKVATQVDSRTILDAGGAEKLLGNGDMLFISSQSAKLKRIQGVLVSEAEVKRVTKFLINQKNHSSKGENLDEASISPGSAKVDFTAISSGPEKDDPLYEEAKKQIIESGKASVSFLQRRLRLGYARAARLMDMLERNGIVGPGAGAKAREILISIPKPPQGVFASQGSLEKIEEEKEPVEDEENYVEEGASEIENRDKWQI